MMHCLTARDDQLDRVKTLGMSVSFFPAHMYYWGEKHYNIFLGPTRASRLSPIGSAIRKNLNYTLHSDSPVVIAGVYNGVNTWLKTISIAVNRVTDAGRLLDDGTQKITAYQALKGMTINSAWQSHEDDTKGSIEVGKVADFAILSLNPLTTKPRDLDNLQVLTTIKTGNVVFGSYPKKRGFGILDELLKVFEQ
jgi:predicted amidohydrolase YtcJ